MTNLTLSTAARGPIAVLLLFGSAAGCGGEGEGPLPPEPPAPAAWDFGLPAGYPKPKVPEENPMSADKVELGRRLFYDKRLSGNETQSCASCHEQKLAFTDGRPSGIGSTGEVHPRGSMSIVNVGYLSTLTWANPLMTELEEQALLPLFGETPVELGLAGKEDVLLERLRKEPIYEALFPKAFPGEADPVRISNVVRAIGAFQRTVISYRSAWDRHNYGGDAKALTDAQKRGKELFFSEKLECFHCHGGFNFSDSVEHDGSTFTETMFHNTGLYNLGGTGAYPEENRGVYEITGVSTDMGRFRAPTLRNITLTAPYMHDGSITTLSEVLDHYAAGGRTIADGPNAGVGSQNPYKSELISGFLLTEEEKADVIAFLEALTDEALLVDPRFSDPWTEDDAGGSP
ncbi:methanobactin export MATE transporter MbnM [Polyangium spumosum]|uniref:Di-heme enzyme n=1 Tax=Polyangium spumosum TaxID=889282 RepID=A0A6N7PTM2_9BACT|nr:methanobactin export MATE transporter MbnM [Polyangium spumosum]MRG94136.1 di-heme enzyme [Polyangium spumosum]